MKVSIVIGLIWPTLFLALASAGESMSSNRLSEAELEHAIDESVWFNYGGDYYPPSHPYPGEPYVLIERYCASTGVCRADVLRVLTNTVWKGMRSIGLTNEEARRTVNKGSEALKALGDLGWPEARPFVRQMALTCRDEDYGRAACFSAVRSGGKDLATFVRQLLSCSDLTWTCRDATYQELLPYTGVSSGTLKAHQGQQAEFYRGRGPDRKVVIAFLLEQALREEEPSESERIDKVLTVADTSYATSREREDVLKHIAEGWAPWLSKAKDTQFVMAAISAATNELGKLRSLPAEKRTRMREALPEEQGN